MTSIKMESRATTSINWSRWTLNNK